MTTHRLNPGKLRIIGSLPAEAWCYDERGGLDVYVEAAGADRPIVVRIPPSVMRKALLGARPLSR